MLCEGLPGELYAHSADDINFVRLRGKRVSVLGAAASAFDAAAVALESGAAEVHLLARRPALAALPVARVRGYPGAYDNYLELPDAVRWQQALPFRRAGSTTPADAIARRQLSELSLASRRPVVGCTGSRWQHSRDRRRGRVPLRLRNCRDRIFRRSVRLPGVGLLRVAHPAMA